MAPQKESMTNYTLRLPADLRELAEEEAKAHGRDLSEELRLALASYYQRPWGLVTNQDLAEKIKEHEENFHMRIAGVDYGSEQHSAAVLSLRPSLGEAPLVLACQPLASASVSLESEIIHGTCGFSFSRSEALEYLQQLQQMLADSMSPTPTDVGAALGKPGRRVGRILGYYGIKAQNTRVGNRSARFYLPSMLGQVEKELKKFGEKE